MRRLVPISTLRPGTTTHPRPYRSLTNTIFRFWEDTDQERDTP